MIIKGTEGMSPEQIRDEIHRGGRIVIHTYCVSILVMTFKRSAGIKLIPAGRNAAAESWPWLLVSLTCGWWGFPWGPIYTVETIYRNLCGGVDVTNEVLAQLPSAAPATPPPVDSSAAVAPAPTPVARVPAKGFDLKVAGVLAGAICAIAAVSITAICVYRRNHLSVALVSGSDDPYTVTLNGTPHTLNPHGVELLTLSEGEFKIEDANGGRVVGVPQKLDLSFPLFDHLMNEKVAVINPDQTAVMADAEVPYYADGTTPPANEAAVFTLLLNQPGYLLPKPDFFFENSDPRTSMPSGTTRIVKHRIFPLERTEASQRISWLAKQKDYNVAKDHLMLLARHRTDEEVLGAATRNLKPDDLQAFFQLHLADRPVLVDWHRYYQNQMEQHFPQHDLLAEYQGYLRAAPQDGALIYLVGRQQADPVEQANAWRASLAAAKPCAYAYSAMAFDELTEGRFEEARTHYVTSMAKGVNNITVQHYHRLACLALGRLEDVGSQLAEARKKDPNDMTLAEQEIINTWVTTHDAGKARQIKNAYLKSYQAAHATAKDLADADAFLESSFCYLAGDLPAYVKSVSHFDAPYYRFRAAFTDGQREVAAKTLSAESPDDTAELLLYMLAQRQGDTAAADRHFANAITAMKRGYRDTRHLAELIEAGHPDAAAICKLHQSIEEKRIVLAALGTRFPSDKQTYFELGRKLNFNPEFPYHFLRTVMAE